MRVLFTVQPSTGHLHPLIPVANHLSAAGHEVAVCSSRSFRPEVEAFGIAHFDAGLDWVTSDHSTWGAFPPMPPPGPKFGEFVVTVFADITAARMIPDLVRIAGDWKPDLIIRESMEYGGCIAAEKLGIPHASIAGNGYSAVDSPKVHYFPGNRRLVAQPLARHRAEFGLTPDADNMMPFRYLHLCFTPESWDAVDTPRPPHSHFMRHENATRPGSSLPAWVNQLPERPTVLASLGTVFNNTPGVLEAIVGGLGGEDINLIVSIGPDRDPSSFGRQPSNVRIERSVPQALILPHCDAFVTHGGFNSVKESLIAGVPMIVIPITADQPYCAERSGDLGLARIIGAEQRTPEAVLSATLEVLNNPAYRRRAGEFRKEMESLPGREEVVSLLEGLVVARTNSSPREVREKGFM